MDGMPRVYDAHCPHLGTHLGHGGRMVGDRLECPFHGWQFDRDGRCVAAPLARAIPGRTRLRAWRVREVNGVVLAWYDPEDGAPDWEMPELPERSLPDWTALRPAKHWTIRTHAQEILENGIDCAHFPHVHRQQTSGVESRGIAIDGPSLTHRIVQHHNIFGIGQRLGWRVTGSLDITCHGLGCVVNRARIRDGISLDYCVVFYVLPIDDERVAVHSYYAMRRKGLLTLPLLRLAMHHGSHTIDQDVPIWENKLFRPHPQLSDADGPIMQFRKWARQFYGSDPARREPAEALDAGHGH
jgi:phenylpropionate dioxygenase-like ring-hydroxylating dioxygenase large terminal subunit